VNQHVTFDLATFVGFEPYISNDRLHVGDDKCLFISNIRHTMLHTPKHTFTLSIVLHVPHITKPLFYVQKFYRDYIAYFEFHASVFYVKDLTTKAILLSGQSNNGLYIMFESSTMPSGLLVFLRLYIC
jgi:hypothetical protein